MRPVCSHPLQPIHLHRTHFAPCPLLPGWRACPMPGSASPLPPHTHLHSPRCPRTFTQPWPVPTQRYHPAFLARPCPHFRIRSFLATGPQDFQSSMTRPLARGPQDLHSSMMAPVTGPLGLLFLQPGTPLLRAGASHVQAVSGRGVSCCPIHRPHGGMTPMAPRTLPTAAVSWRRIPCSSLGMHRMASLRELLHGVMGS